MFRDIEKTWFMEIEIPVHLPAGVQITRISDAIHNVWPLHSFEHNRGVENSITGFGIGNIEGNKHEEFRRISDTIRKAVWAILEVYVDVNIRFIPIELPGSTAFTGDHKASYLAWMNGPPPPKNEIPESVWSEIEEEGFGVRGDYSGRGMFGEQCAAFTCDAGYALRLGVLLHQHMGKSAEELAESFSTDSMGHGIVIYFKGWTLENWKRQEEEEEEDQEEEEG